MSRDRLRRERAVGVTGCSPNEERRQGGQAVVCHCGGITTGRLFPARGDPPIESRFRRATRTECGRGQLHERQWRRLFLPREVRAWTVEHRTTRSFRVPVVRLEDRRPGGRRDFSRRPGLASTPNHVVGRKAELGIGANLTHRPGLRSRASEPLVAPATSPHREIRSPGPTSPSRHNDEGEGAEESRTDRRNQP